MTRSWLKTVWEKCHAFKFEVILNNIPLKMSREGDDWLMRRFMQLGYRGKELERLNKVRVHQQVLFLYDIMCAGGT